MSQYEQEHASDTTSEVDSVASDMQRPAPNEKDKLGDLPEELLIRIFGHIEAPDLFHLRLVSTRVTGPATVCCFRNLATTVFEDARFLFPISTLHSSPVAQTIRAVHINPSALYEPVSEFSPLSWTHLISA